MGVADRDTRRGHSAAIGRKFERARRGSIAEIGKDFFQFNLPDRCLRFHGLHQRRYGRDVAHHGASHDAGRYQSAWRRRHQHAYARFPEPGRHDPILEEPNYTAGAAAGSHRPDTRRVYHWGLGAAAHFGEGYTHCHR
jgi:hypothetical protein